MCDKVAFNNAKKSLFDKYFGFLNPKQREAVYTVNGPLLVLAGAGSGKTTVIVNRIANIILFGNSALTDTLPENADSLLPLMQNALKNGNSSEIREVLRKCAVEPAEPYRVLCITFTNKAAREFKERLALTLGDCAGDIWAGTFHSICVRILRRHINLLDYSNDFTIYDTDDCKKLITEILKELNIHESVLPVKTALRYISASKDNDRTADEELLLAGNTGFPHYVASVYKIYQSRLKSANALDFDDIIMLTNRLFDLHPDVLNRYREHFKYILVDEYQDTNPSQSNLVSKLANSKKNVCVVGDDDQSIYSFRGATVENILGFDREYRNTKIIRLEQNYRSAGNILKAANGIIENNTDRKGKELWTEAPDGEKVHIKKLFNQISEAEFICETIMEKVAKGAQYSDFAVLYRANSLSNSLETSFVKKRIPYKIYGGLRFYERREIKDILAYLSVIANPSDTVRLRRIINVPRRAIGDTTVDKIASIATENDVTMFSVIENARVYQELKRASQKLEQFARMINELSDFSKNHTLQETVSEVIEKTGYRVMLSEEDDGAEREENVLELVSSAALFAETAENPTLAEFLNEIALVSDLDSHSEDNNSVTLMTVHSAKGLEFNTVFIPGLEENVFPTYQASTGSDKDISQERRLAYVAVTRAKKSLYLLHTEKRTVYDKTVLNMPSRFLAEIPQSVCDHSERSSFSQNTSYQTPSGAKNNIWNKPKSTQTAAEVYGEGSVVMHPMFGKGEILSATPMGGDVLYEIEFANGSVKRLMGNFAKLKKC